MLNPSIKQEISAELARREPRFQPADFSFELIVSDDRNIYRVNAPGSANYIFKTVGSARKSASEFIDEFAVLSKLSTKAATSGKTINTPVPIKLLDDQGMLMTECPGDTLKSHYFRSLVRPLERTGLVDAIRQGAALLADIHGLSLRTEKYADFRQNRQANLSRMIDAALQHPAEKPRAATLRRAGELFEEINGEYADIAICELHGNFALRNLLWDGAVVSTIDLEDSRTDTVYYDVALLVAEFINKNMFPLSRAYNSRLAEAFLQSYRERYPLDPRLLTSYVIYHLVWSYYELATRSKARNPVKRLIVGFRKRQLCREIGKQIRTLA